MSDSLRVLIVDDEPLARDRIREFCSREPDVVVVGEAGNGQEALDLVARVSADLVFLDVQMPAVDGFAFLELLEPGQRPAVVFVTAYDAYALRAFEVHAMDYLLKPFDRERFQGALARVREALRGRRSPELESRLSALLAEVARERRAERLVVRHGQRTLLIRTQDVDWIEAAANYVKLHVGRETYLLRETMVAMEQQLDPARFARIHRSTIVNVDRIAHLESWFHGDYKVKLTDGTSLTLSRTFRESFEQRLGRAI